MRGQVGSTDRPAALRRRILSLAKTCSIGLKGGRQVSAGGADSFDGSPLWMPRLSRITMWRGLSVGSHLGDG